MTPWVPMRRGDVIWVDLDPAKGNEADKARPAVIVSNDGANQVARKLGRGVVTVAPLTRSVERIYPFQVLVPVGAAGLRFASKVQAEQIRSVSVDRLGAVVGRLPGALMDELDDALRLHLAM